MGKRHWRTEAFEDGPLLILTKNFENWHKKRATEELRKKCWGKLFGLRDEIKRRPQARPRVGHARRLKGIESPVHYIKLTGDLRILYYVIHEKGRRSELWVLDVSDHDYLSSSAKAAEHLVHGAGLDNLLKIVWDDSKVVGEEFSWDDAIGSEKEKVEAYEKWLKKPGIFNEERDKIGSDEEVFRAFDSAAILQQYIVGPQITQEELEEKWLEEGDLAPDIRLKDEQKAFLGDSSKIFVLEGVAGTGKTTVLERRFAIYCEKNDNWRERALFLTHNESLTQSVLSHLKKIFPEEEHENLENVVVDVETWVRRLLAGLSEDSANKFKQNRKITYDTFASLISKSGKSGSESGVLWEEYRGVIQGACTGPGNMLTLRQYQELSRDRGLWEKDENKRAKVYSDIEKFRRKLERDNSDFSTNNGGWTDQDLARYVRQGRIAEGDTGFLDVVFIDEVQDLTELQILLILDCIDKQGQKRFEAAGDVSQSVYPSAFRFDDLRKRVYENLNPKEFPKPHLMTTNYRATPYLVEAANFVLKKHKEVKQEQIDVLKTSKAASSSSGSHPGVIRVQGLDEFLDILGDKGLPNPWCPLVVRDERLIEEIEKRLDNSYILSIPGSKGLEFENVVIWDPFSGTDRLIDDYFHHKKGKVEFKPEGVCLELRHLFVAITRARYRLAVVSTGEYSGPPMTCSGMDWLESNSEIFSRRDGNFLDEFTKKDATPGEYAESALVFESKGEFKLAAAAFRDADRLEDACRCKAKMHREKGQLSDASWEFEEAARYASEADEEGTDHVRGYLRQALKCLDSAIEVSDGIPAIELYQSKSRLATRLGDERAAAEARALFHERMSDHQNEEIRNPNLRKAAEAYQNLGESDKAIELLKRIPDYPKIAEISLSIGRETDFFEAIEKILAPREEHHDTLSAIYEQGNHEWRDVIAGLMGIERDELAGISPKRDQKKALMYSSGDKRLELTLEEARSSGNWPLVASTLEEMGRITESAELMHENGEGVSAVMLLLRNLTDENRQAMNDIRESLDRRERRELHSIVTKNRNYQDILIREFERMSPSELVKMANGGVNMTEALAWLRLLSGPLERGEHPLVRSRSINKEIIDNLRQHLFFGIAHNEGRVSSETFNFSIYYLIFINQHKQGKWWNGQAKELLRELWYIGRFSEVRDKSLESIKFSDNFLYQVVRDAATSVGLAEGVRVWQQFYSNYPQKVMSSQKSLDLVKLIYAYSVLDKMYDDVKEGFRELREYKFNISQFILFGGKKWQKYEKQVASKNRFSLSQNHWDQLWERGLSAKKVNDFLGGLELEYTQPPESFTNEIIDWAYPVNEVFRVEGGWLDQIELDGFKEKQRELEEARKEEARKEEARKEEARKEEARKEEGRKEDESISLAAQEENTSPAKVDDLWADEQMEEERIVPEFPLEMASESADPYVVFTQVSNRFLEDSEKSEMAAFADLWPVWEREIEVFWDDPSMEEDHEIALIAAQQYIIDSNKRLLPTIPVTHQYSSLILSRASRHLERLTKYTWGQRCFRN